MLHIFQHGIYFNPLPPHGGRLSYCAMCTISTYFNPLPPHGGRLFQAVDVAAETGISIHSLRMEGDNECPEIIANFCISIHSLRMEGDLERRQKRTGVRYFNPLPPHGGRQVICVSVIIVFLFQSTPSAWRETVPSC